MSREEFNRRADGFAAFCAGFIWALVVVMLFAGGLPA